MRETVRDELASLPPKYRLALTLRHLQDLSYEEISQVLEVSLGTVKSRILRGRESLRKHLLDRMRETPQVEWPIALGRHVGAHVGTQGSDAV